MNHALLLASVPLLILANAFFVASEYAVVATRPVDREAMRKRGRRRAADALERLQQDPASAIAAIQVCITVTNLALGSLGEPVMTRTITAALGPLADAIPEAVFRPAAVALAFLIVTLLTVVFSELLPKALTLRHTQTAAAVTAVPVLGISWLVHPLVRLMNGLANLVTVPLGLGRVQSMEEQGVSLDELRLMAVEAASEGVLTTDERALILNTLALQERQAKRIMVPRIEVDFLDLQWSMDENRAALNRRLHTRMPLCNGGLDNIVGVVRTKQFLTAYHAAGDSSVLSLIADEPVFVPEFASIGQVLSTFHQRKTEFVILVDEYGGMSGIVTLRDVVDDLLGVVDESKALFAEARQGDISGREGRRVVRGDLAVHELARLLDRPDWAAARGSSTVAGLIQDALGQIGTPGAEVVIDNVRLRVVHSDGRAIRRVEVKPLAAAAT